jgi:hypothetical protein
MVLVYVPAASQYAPLIIKYNSSGVLQWARLIRYQSLTGYSLLMEDIRVRGSSMSLTGQAVSIDKANYDAYGFSGYGYNIFTVRLPTDGSKTGTYSPGGGMASIVYESYSLNGEIAGSTTSTASSFTEAASNGIDNTVSYTTNTISTVQLTRAIA